MQQVVDDGGERRLDNAWGNVTPTVSRVASGGKWAPKLHVCERHQPG